MPALEDYRETQIMTATPMELVLLLYDECINSLTRAEDAFSTDGPQSIEQVNNNLLRAQDIIAELVVSLDMEKGGAIAENLHRLYDFMVTHLSKANLEKNPTPIREVKDMMTELRGTWQQVADKEPEREPSQIELSNDILYSG